MHWTIVVLVTASGCGFSSRVVSDDAGPPIDASPVNDAGVDAPFDAPPGICIGRFVVVCRPVAPPTNLTFLATATINTDLDPRCDLQGQGPGAPTLCVMVGNDVKVDAPITVIGSHPLVLAAYHDLNITTKGTLILTSPSGQPGAGANDPACHAPTAGGSGTLGSGGGAGGSFGGSGGAGGTGGNSGATAGTAGAPIAPIARVTGGCKGSQGGAAGLVVGGVPGDGGGAVMLLAAHKLTLAGIVTAGGGGGSPAIGAGGGGGGSGGFIGLDAMSYAIMGTGRVTANGGGGASGGATALSGLPGNDGTSSTTIVASGGVAPLGGGDGGNGSIALQPNGTAGQNAANGGGGGGGGGGGAGVILLKGTAPAGGSYSPPLTIVP